LPRGLDRLGASVTHRIDEAIDGADVVMMLRIQHERMLGGFFPTLREYAAFYGLDARRMKRAASGAIVMHPGPINRGVEIMGDIADGAASVILDQVRSGVAVRMAVLYLLAGGDREAPAQER
jgi:aspartate carbamoyltransferase catalytic subunit